MSVYDTVTNRIVEELERGTVPWVKPWKTTLPYNAVSEKAYSGVNILLLWSLPHTQPAWLTPKQVNGFGGYVKKGERATPILYASTYKKKRVDASGEEAQEVIPFLKCYFVFNIEQCEGLPTRLHQRPVLTTDETYEEANRFLAHIGATVKHGGSVACFVPSLDLIRLPNAEDFEGPEHYFATSLHEHGHWSGHGSRLNRDLSGRFGEGAYAAEELIAEMTAAFLCAHLGVSGRLRHADYIASWLQVLKKDKKAIFTAARKATEAAAYLRSFPPTYRTGRREEARHG